MRQVIIFLILIISNAAHAQTWLCEEYGFCGGSRSGRSSSAPAQPTTSSTISINPAAVPTHDTVGIEALFYDNSLDFALVKGLGRVGAAISPSNNEETFFGPPAFEFENILLDRKRERRKLPAQKYTLATAFNIFQNRKSGLKRFELNLGIIAKYNRISNMLSGGGGLSAVAGPFTFGYSSYGDAFIPDEEYYRVDPTSEILYGVETFSAGIFLNSVALDYSELHTKTERGDLTTKTTLLTASLLTKKAILTLSHRKEISDRPEYNFTDDVLEYRKEKQDYFGGIQLVATKNLLLGVYYNYYLMREASVGATFFF